MSTLYTPQEKKAKGDGGGEEEASRSMAANPGCWVETNGLESILSQHGLFGRGQEFLIWGSSQSVKSKGRGVCLEAQG